MKAHNDILIFLLLKLYVEGTDNPSIPLKQLKQGLEALITKIKQKYNQKITFNFQEEIRIFLDKYSEYCELENDSLVVIEDLKEFYNAVTSSHSRLSTLDYEMQEEIFDDKIYQALNIKVPFEVLKRLIILNEKIILGYLKLGQNELENKIDESTFHKLKQSIDELNEAMIDLSSSDLTKIRICLYYYNQKYLPQSKKRFNNSMWHTILFSNNPTTIYSIAYARIEFITSLIDPETDEISEEILNAFFNTEEDQTLEELPYFLIHVLFGINNYLKDKEPSLANEGLLIKKYLLMACPELTYIESHILKEQRIDNFDMLPLREPPNEKSFEVLKNFVIECTCYLVKDNNELKKPHILVNVITCSIFIRTFLELSVNDDSKEDIIDLITNSLFQQKPNYNEVAKIVNDIIFGSPNLLR